MSECSRFLINGVDFSGELNVTIDSRVYHFKFKDIKYLLCEVDGEATKNPIPPEYVIFTLQGVPMKVTNEEWAEFVDILQSAIGELGWATKFVS